MSDSTVSLTAPFSFQGPAYTHCPHVRTSEAGFPFAAAVARAGRQADLAEEAPLSFLSLHPLHKRKEEKKKKIQKEGRSVSSYKVQQVYDDAYSHLRRSGLPLAVFLELRRSFWQEPVTNPLLLNFYNISTTWKYAGKTQARQDEKETSSGLLLSSYCNCFGLPRCRHIPRPDFTWKTGNSISPKRSKPQNTWPVMTPNLTTSGSSHLPVVQMHHSQHSAQQHRAQLQLGDQQRIPHTSF